MVATRTPTLIQDATPPQVYYDDYFAGICRDPSFGLSLADYTSIYNIREGAIPKVLRLCISEVEARGMLIHGIYQVSGHRTGTRKLRWRFERCERSQTPDLSREDIHTVSSLLKVRDHDPCRF